MHTKRFWLMPAAPSWATSPFPETTRSLGGGRHSMFSRASASLELDPLFGQKFFESFDRLGEMSASRLDPPTPGWPALAKRCLLFFDDSLRLKASGPSKGELNIKQSVYFV